MKSPDSVYRDVVDREIDRLARLSPCELMQLEPGNCVFNTEVGPVEVAYLISDSGDVRHIAVVAELSLILGLAKRKYAGALKVELSMERLSNNEVADLYD